MKSQPFVPAGNINAFGKTGTIALACGCCFCRSDRKALRAKARHREMLQEAYEKTD